MVQDGQKVPLRAQRIECPRRFVVWQVTHGCNRVFLEAESNVTVKSQVEETRQSASKCWNRELLIQITSDKERAVKQDHKCSLPLLRRLPSPRSRSDNFTLTMSSSLPTLPPSFRVVSTTKIASLWSNYGYIHRLTLSSEPSSLILKSIHPPTLDHPDESHLRKLLSYDIERWFYRHLATRLPSTVKLAKSYPPRKRR